MYKEVIPAVAGMNPDNPFSKASNGGFREI
jgi:hypothetical protein